MNSQTSGRTRAAKNRPRWCRKRRNSRHRMPWKHKSQGLPLTTGSPGRAPAARPAGGPRRPAVWRNASTRAGWRRSARVSGTSRTSSTCPGEAVRNRRRSASMIASGREWVTNRAVAPCRSSRSSSRRRRRWAVGSSSETKGSSSSSRLGWTTKARARAARRAMPSDRREANTSAAASSSTSARAAAIRGAGSGVVGQDQAQIVGHRAPGQQARLLEDVAEPRARRELEAAREAGHEAGHDVEQRGLAATGRADDREALARLDRQPDVGQGDLGRGAAHRGEAVLAQLEAQRRHWPALRSIGCRMPHSISWTTTMNDSA